MNLIADREERLDQFIARLNSSVSRTRLARLITQGGVTVDGELEKPSFRLQPGMEVEFELPGEVEPHDLTPFPMDLDIVYEDAHLLVVNKPRGLATHPAPTLSEPTLVNALLAHGSNLSQGSAPFRPGVVHRLDKDTTGLLLVAKTNAAHVDLAEQIASKTAVRGYLAAVRGKPESDDFQVDAPIGRDPRNRLRMSVDSAGKPAQTHVKVLRFEGDRSLLGLRLATGRTHQIRVHLAAIGFPVIGDSIYGGGPGAMALHAAVLGFDHPGTGARIVVTRLPPPDFPLTVNEAEIQLLTKGA